MDTEFAAVVVELCSGGRSGGLSKTAAREKVNYAASLACKSAQASKRAAECVDKLFILASNDASLNIKGVLFVVDCIFCIAGAEDDRRAEGATRFKRHVGPQLRGWIHHLILNARDVLDAEKARLIVTRWHELGVLSESDTCCFIRLVDEQSFSPICRKTGEDAMGSRMVNPLANVEDDDVQILGVKVASEGKTKCGDLASEECKGSKIHCAEELLEEASLESPGKRPRQTMLGEFFNLPTSSDSLSQRDEMIGHPRRKQSSSEGESGVSQEQPRAELLVSIKESQDSQEKFASQGAVHVKSVDTPDVWKVRGDCRCLFRAVCRACEDPGNVVERDALGEPLSPHLRERERDSADELRARVCGSMRQRLTEVASLLCVDADGADAFIRRLEDWRTWGDGICLCFLPDLVDRPIQVYALNAKERCVFETGLHLPKDKAMQAAPVIVLWYNGKCHYDLVSARWLRRRERALCSRSGDGGNRGAAQLT
eukprot:TRINITY_DN62167_c0_g1_i1.p1 TRINITY_DN62167_c0_g1~~TRINITY_DN62167_c0_g1_i1.p1  ORF type:complete len:485 (+),score=78.16 TRINITY_DN62167_c0_g1_i1:75-1529(+)